MKKKNIALLLSAVLVLVSAVGVTIAWLMDDAGPVTNTFTVGNIDILLDEADVDDSDDDQNTTDRDTANTYKMIPGFTYAKDPKVTVVGGSEECWLFVKVMETGGAINWIEESGTVTKTFDDFIEYQLLTSDTEWKALTGVSGVENVYYRQVGASETDQSFKIIANDQVKVKDTVTKKMMDELKMAIEAETPESTVPTLSFKAAAVQYYKSNGQNFEPADAYALVADKL